MIQRPPWIERFTSNLSERSDPIEAIVLHHSGGHEVGDLATLCNDKTDKKVSADFYINKRGVLYKLNPQLREFYTWHAGIAEFEGHIDVNHRTLGVEMEHKPGEEWTREQVEKVAWLCAWIYETHIAETKKVTSHHEVARPRNRKTDPENFPWDQFSAWWHHYIGSSDTLK